MGTTWQQLSTEISQTVDQAGKSIVAVDGRSGHTSSGIVWRSDSIVTASHAVRHEAGVRVIVGFDRVVQARVIGRNRGADIVVLKLDQPLESTAEFGSAASLTVGNLVVAVARTRRGNIVASTGVISGLMGEWQNHRTRLDQFIRPDINLYSGFSGGALVGPDGKVLGMNTSALVRGRPITIPSSTVVRVAEELSDKGHLTQPYIGLAMQPVQIPASLQKTAGVGATTGLLVMHVEPGGPADAGGTMLGDLLLELDGTSFDDLDHVHEVLDRKGAGQEVEATLLRGGSRIQATIRIGERPAG